MTITLGNFSQKEKITFKSQSKREGPKMRG